ncbi:arginase [Roseivirga sp. BDSF3-8]|uniref:arginase n=1 Tax=Roseivirga sp. BDSF3-8 TaxID=3241598 RepID=UPI0035327524
MKKIKILEVKSEIAAGTRGASLGIDAIKTACLDKGSDYFGRYESEEVENVNDILFDGFKHPNAKYIDGVLIMLTRVCESTFTTLRNGHMPLVLAGDHSTAAGTIAGIKKAHPDKRLGVIWIDAHSDLHTPFTTPSGNMHGMPLAAAAKIDNLESKVNDPKEDTLMYWDKIKRIGVEEPKINLEDIFFIALRDFEKPESALIEKYGINVIKTQEARSIGMEETATRALTALAACDLIYVSFDVDSLDTDVSRGTGTPVPGGLTLNEAKELNSLLMANDKVVCWEMVEVNPTLDTENAMAENAFEVLEEVTKSYEARASIEA